MYEGVILELRSELDRLSSKYHDVCHKLEETVGQTARIEQLEEEIQMYKETAKAAALESQTLAFCVVQPSDLMLRGSNSDCD